MSSCLHLWHMNRHAKFVSYTDVMNTKQVECLFINDTCALIARTHQCDESLQYLTRLETGRSHSACREAGEEALSIRACVIHQHVTTVTEALASCNNLIEPLILALGSQNYCQQYSGGPPSTHDITCHATRDSGDWLQIENRLHAHSSMMKYPT